MVTAEYHAHPYVRALNEYHSELAMLHDALSHVLSEVDGPDWLTSSSHIFASRFSHLVEHFPYPDPAVLAK